MQRLGVMNSLSGVQQRCSALPSGATLPNAAMRSAKGQLRPSVHLTIQRIDYRAFRDAIAVTLRGHVP